MQTALYSKSHTKDKITLNTGLGYGTAVLFCKARLLKLHAIGWKMVSVLPFPEDLPYRSHPLGTLLTPRALDLSSPCSCLTMKSLEETSKCVFLTNTFHKPKPLFWS